MGIDIRSLTPNELAQLVTDIENYKAELEAEVRRVSDLRIALDMRIVDEDAPAVETAPGFTVDMSPQDTEDEGGNLYIDEGARQASGKIKYRVLDDNDKQVASLVGKGRSWDVKVGKQVVAHGNTKQKAIDAYVETLA